MPLPQVCVCYLVREHGGVTQVLLGRKKHGLGQGYFVGLGGKLEPGESAVDAAVQTCGTDALVLFRTLADAGWTGTLVTVSRGLHRIRGDEAGCYPAALTATLGETFGVEHPDLRTWHLDLPGRDVAADTAVLASATTSKSSSSSGT